MNKKVIIGEAKNKEKLLELGKEITQVVIDRFEDSFYGYVKVKDIKDETLISIGKKLYSNPEAFMDYLRNVYEEDNFEWDESAINSYDLIHDIVSASIVESGEYYFDYDSEMYLLKTDVSEVESKESLISKINSIEKLSPLTIMLNEKEGDFILVMTPDNKQDYILENRISCSEKELIQTKYRCLEADDYVALADTIRDLISKYKSSNKYKEWSNKETAERFWEYMHDSEEFENIRLYLSTVELDKFLNCIIKTFNKEDSENINNIKKELLMYQNGIIDCIEDTYSELKEIVWKTVYDNLRDEFKYNENYVWIPLSDSEKFEGNLKKRLSKLEDINTLKLFEVLPKDIEKNILLNFVKENIAKGIEEKWDDIHVITPSDHFWEEADKNVDLFFREGTLKNLNENELNSMYREFLLDKDNESIKEMSTRCLKEYFLEILTCKNDTDNKLTLMAVYYLLLDNLDKVEPHLNNMFKNGFTLDKLEHKIKSINCNCIDKKEISEEVDDFFKSYLSV